MRGETKRASGVTVGVSLVPLASDVAPLIERARNFCQDFPMTDGNLRKAAAEALLDLHNDTWNDGDPIDAATFIQRLSIDGVVFSPRDVEAFYSDGGLFAGHLVIVPFDDAGTIGEAYLGG